VTGSKVATQVLCQDMQSLTGGRVIINNNARESAELLERIILEKRAALKI
jgi:carbon-monoxide dehydrogenase catalytic subunit